MRLVCVLVWAATATVSPPSFAQGQKPVPDVLPPASIAFVRSADRSLQFNSQRIPGGRLDADDGVLRSAYRIEAAVPVQATPELTARMWMADNGGRFGWGNADDLVLVDEIRTSYSTHLPTLSACKPAAQGRRVSWTGT